jgi:hypothetical protein
LLFQVGVILDDAIVTQIDFHIAMAAGLKTATRYMPAVLACVYANETPDDALRSVQHDA